MKPFRAFLSILTSAALLFAGCSSTGNLAPGVPTAVTFGTSLAVNAYPAAAPLVEMLASGVRAATAKGPVSPDDLAAFLAPYASAGEAFVARVSPGGAADVTKFVAALNAKYRQEFPRIQAGTLSVEEFAQAVEAGA